MTSSYAAFTRGFLSASITSGSCSSCSFMLSAGDSSASDIASSASRGRQLSGSKSVDSKS